MAEIPILLALLTTAHAKGNEKVQKVGLCLPL